MPKVIKVLIIDDSHVVRNLLKHMIESQPGMKVLGAVTGGAEALSFLAESPVMPDVITTDMNMPKMNGLETTRQIMRHYAIPILIVTGSCEPSSEEKVFQSLDAGALAILSKPAGINDPHFASIRQELLTMITVMSEVKVVRRRFTTQPSLSTKSPMASIQQEEKGHQKINAVAIGASTGGPQALHQLLSALPEMFPTPIFVVQHISNGFVEGLAAWLNQDSRLKVKVALDGEQAMLGHVYLAPDCFHMEIDTNNKIILSKSPAEKEVTCPSIARLFRSMAYAHGPHGVGILLTGMGRDGAEDLLLMKQKGAYTIAESEESAVIFGMPKEAILLGGATKVLPVSQIAEILKIIVKN
jgi:two-component system chemotaxis response regulator CheB